MGGYGHGDGDGDGMGPHPEEGGSKSCGEDGKIGFQAGSRQLFLSTSKLPDSSLDLSGSGYWVNGGVWLS